jgi:hypothetical protein
VPRFYFKLVDTTMVADHGIRELADAAHARSEAIKLAQSLREARPQLRGKHYSILVTDESGAGVCMISLNSSSAGTQSHC